MIIGRGGGNRPRPAPPTPPFKKTADTSANQSHLGPLLRPNTRRRIRRRGGGRRGGAVGGEEEELGGGGEEQEMRWGEADDATQ